MRAFGDFWNISSEIRNFERIGTFQESTIIWPSPEMMTWRRGRGQQQTHELRDCVRCSALSELNTLVGLRNDDDGDDARDVDLVGKCARPIRIYALRCGSRCFSLWKPSRKSTAVQLQDDHEMGTVEEPRRKRQGRARPALASASRGGSEFEKSCRSLSQVPKPLKR